MKITVDLPQPIPVNRKDSIELYLPDSGGAFVSVDGEGIIKYVGNGHGAPVFSLDLVATANSIKQQTKQK